MKDENDDNVVPLPPPLPRIDRPVPPEFDPERIVRHLRMREQDPWALTDGHGAVVAIEWNVGEELPDGGAPVLRLRIDLAGGERRGDVRVFLLLNEEKRRRLATFPEDKPSGSTDDIENAIDKALAFCLELARGIERGCRAVRS